MTSDGTAGPAPSESQVLERLLDNLRVTVEPFAVSEISNDWRLRLSGTPWVTIHYVLEGDGRLHIRGHESTSLGSCTLVVVPEGQSHTVEHAAGSRHEENSDCGPRPDGLLQFIAGHDGTREVVLISGRLSAIYGGSIDVFGRIATPVVLDFSSDPVITQLFDRLLTEQRNPTIGSAAMCAAIMNECVIHILRAMSKDPGTDLMWLAAAEDPHLAPALDQILERPDAPHTVDSLATHAAMSRSTFHDRFTAAIGQTPIRFLREVRLRKAADLLQTTNHSVDNIASLVGFESRSHFSRKFTELFGRSPTGFRAESGASPEVEPG